MQPKTLNLTLNKKWFDMIASGDKKEEYREIKHYWINRLTWHEYHNKSADEIIEILNNKTPNSVLKSLFYDIVSANNGYSKGCLNIKWKHEGIKVGEGREEWGAEKGKRYFILKIGEIVSLDN